MIQWKLLTYMISVVWYLFIRTVFTVGRSWKSSGMILEKTTWVWFPARVSAVYSKLFWINDLVFQFLMKHLHIAIFLTKYQLSKGVQLYGINSAIFSHFFFVLLNRFSQSKEKPILGYVCKVADIVYKTYVICISWTNLSPFRSIFRNRLRSSDNYFSI